MAAQASSLNGIANTATMRLVSAADTYRVFGDSKTVVDRPLKEPAAAVAAAFAELSLPETPAGPEAAEQGRAQLAALLERWTEEEGSDMENLASIIRSPPAGWLPGVADPNVREWAEWLYKTWGELGRQLAPGVRQRPELHSLLWVPNAFVVPGARFREVYYWDSYWVVKGLLASELVALAQGVVDNMLYLVETYGHVPNGIRSYYLNRSQPPLLSEMVRVVHEAQPDPARLSRALEVLLTEHAYWTSSQGPAAKQVVVRGPDGRLYHLSRYCADWRAPRPESYREDMETAQQSGLGEPGRLQLWQDLASAAESGWDFSSRWLADGQTLATVQTTKVIPADLNAFLFQMEANIARFAGELGDTSVAAQFLELAEARREAINALMWDPDASQWRDLILCSDSAPYAAQQSLVVAASNWVPLFCGVLSPGCPQALQAVHALQGSGLCLEGGLAATAMETGQQWDFPNVWPPMVDMAAVGAEQYGGQPGAALASSLVQAYLKTAYTAWRQSGCMFEKFNAQRVGAPGHGGEYQVVAGFGWTNGVALSFLKKYGWQL